MGWDGLWCDIVQIGWRWVVPIGIGLEGQAARGRAEEGYMRASLDHRAPYMNSKSNGTGHPIKGSASSLSLTLEKDTDIFRI